MRPTKVKKTCRDHVRITVPRNLSALPPEPGTVAIAQPPAPPRSALASATHVRVSLPAEIFSARAANHVMGHARFSEFLI